MSKDEKNCKCSLFEPSEGIYSDNFTVVPIEKDVSFALLSK
jgi:hypothetical protein